MELSEIPYVVLVSIDVVDRRDVEGISTLMPPGYVGDEFDFVAEQLGIERGMASVVPLQTFCLAANEQEIETLDNVWMWHFTRLRIDG